MDNSDGLRLSDYDYELPKQLIAQRPAERRHESRLMVVHRGSGRLEHRRFSDIGDYLAAGDLLVVNDTKVVPARVRGVRHTGGKVEALFVREVAPGRWEIMLKAGGRPRPGEVVGLAGGRLPIRLLRKTEAGWLVSVARNVDVHQTLEEAGETPLPPYIDRTPGEGEAFHRERYQTVFAREAGAVAAPTAGLHFSETLVRRLQEAGVEFATITLHVGPGTFLPVRTEDVRRHRMHAEFYRVSAQAAAKVRAAEQAGGRVVAVGTTCCRVLESGGGDEITATEGWTDLFIRPPHRFRHTDALLTNFHLPRTSLLMLVAAFAGRELILGAYREAVAERYRFYSYGEAMLIL